MKFTRRFSRHSLSGKLLLLFIVMAVVVVMLVGSSTRHVFRAHFDKNIRPHLVQYLSYVQQDIGYPPNRERARQLSAELNVEIFIQDQQGYWSSNGRQLALDELKIKHYHKIGNSQYALVEIEAHDNFLMIEKNGTKLFFGIPERERELHIRSLIPLLLLVFVQKAMLLHTLLSS